MIKFSKFQKIIKFFEIKFLCLDFVCNAIRFGMNYKMWLAIILITIILPSFIKSDNVFGTQISPEFNNSYFMPIECQGKGFIDADFGRSIGGIPIVEISEFGNEGTFEIGRGFVERLPGNQFLGEIISERPSQQCPQNSSKDRSNGRVHIFSFWWWVIIVFTAYGTALPGILLVDKYC